MMLKRKADVLSKVYYRMNKNEDLFAYIQQMSCDADHVKARQFAMYAFEVMSEVNLSEEELQSAKGQFMGIFEKTLADA
jgi:hypothetical protein